MKGKVPHNTVPLKVSSASLRVTHTSDLLAINSQTSMIASFDHLLEQLTKLMESSVLMTTSFIMKDAIQEQP